MALEVIGSNPITHPTEREKAVTAFFHIRINSRGTLGCSQAVRHGTLTPAFRRSESCQPNQNRQTPEGVCRFFAAWE